MAFKCVPESSVRRLVECPICFDTFINPKELDCQHTFCEKPCLDKLVNSTSNTLKCPLCRVVHNIPKGGIRELKTNKTIADLVELTEKLKTADDAKAECEVCFSKEYTDECLHCSKMVCADCQARHTEHMLLDVQQLASSVLEATKSSLVQVEAAKCDLENDVTTMKSKVRETIDELMRHIQQRGKDIEHELDHHLATEISKITVVDDMCLKLNEVIGTCHEIKKNTTSATSQVTIEVKRKLLVEQYKDITAKFSMPSVSTIDVHLTTESICDSIQQVGTIIQVKNSQTQSSENVQSSQPNMNIICGAPGTKDAIHPRSAIPVTAPTIEMASVSAGTNDVSHPRNSTKGIAPVPVSLDSNTMPSQGTAHAVDVRSGTRNITHPRKTIRCTDNYQFMDITSVAISPVTGDIAVCDMGRHVIVVFTERGEFKTEFGGLGRRPGLFNTPRGVTYNTSGHIIVADSLNNRIQIFDEVYHIIKAFSQKGSGGYDVCDPRDVAASESNIWVCDYGNNRIRIFTKDGKTSPGNSITSRSFINPTRVLFDHLHGSICILDSNGRHYFEPRNKAEMTFKNATTSIAEHHGIAKNSAIAFSEDGMLIYTDISNIIFVFDKKDKFVKSFMSLEAEKSSTAIKALAIRKSHIVVAGSTFIEIY